MGLIGPDAEMAELNLGLGPRQRGRPLEGRWVAILVSESDHLLARRRDQRRKGDADARARRKPYAASKADDRIEHRADRVGERPAVDHRGRCPDPAAAAEEPTAVGFPLQAADRLAFDDHHVGEPDRRLAARPWPARRQESVQLGRTLGVHEQVGKRRVGRIGRR